MRSLLRPAWLRRVAAAWLATVPAACSASHLRVSDPSATIAYSHREDDRGVRVGLGYQVERVLHVVGAGATAHVGYDSVGDTPVGWAEAHATLAFVSGIVGAWGDRGGAGALYGLSVGWLLPTCEGAPRSEKAALTAGDREDCWERRRFVPRLFYVVEVAGDGPDRGVLGLEVAAGWW